MTTHTPMKADTSHIEACRKLWLEHHVNCIECIKAGLTADYENLCKIGINLRDEYQQAISVHLSAHPDCEKVEL